MSNIETSFFNAYFKAEEAIEKLKTMCDNHFGKEEGKIDWADVGDMEKIARELKDIISLTDGV